ncbi:MAG: META domain-containing protein [Chloroflexota bacterium]
MVVQSNDQRRKGRPLVWLGLILSLLLLLSGGCVSSGGAAEPANEPADSMPERETGVESEAVLETNQEMIDKVTLEAQEWRLISFLKGGAVVAIEAGDVTLTFEGDNLSGRAACNGFNTTYSIDEAGATVSSQIAMTRMMCEDALNQLERTFIEALTATTNIYQRDGQLVLEAADGEMVFEQIAVE